MRTEIEELNKAAAHLTEAMRTLGYEEGLEAMTAHGIVTRLRAKLEQQESEQKFRGVLGLAQ